MPDNPLHILQICFRMPYPLKDGGAIAMYQIAKGLFENGCEITMLVPGTSKHKIEIQHIPQELKSIAKVISVNINTNITFFGALMNIFSKESYYTSRYKNRKFRNTLIDILQSENFDIIQIESLKMITYLKTIRKYSAARIVLRSHNIEYMIWQRMAETTNGLLKKCYLRYLAKKIKREEIGSLNDVDALVPITDVDGKLFSREGCTKPIFPTSTGIFAEKMVPNNPKIEPYSLFYLGALDWMPNLDALNWFMQYSWPLIREQFPQVKLYIAGRNMPAAVYRYNSQQVIVAGEIDDAAEFMNSKQVMLVPLLSGSGMRIKIVEGMALGKVIISTTIGAEGIDCENGRHILIADTPEVFAEMVGYVINDQKFADEISRNAQLFVKEKFDNHQICKKLSNDYRKLLK